MTPGRRAFLEKYAAQWSRRSEDRRATGVLIDARIADALDRIVGEMLNELASAPPPEPIADDPDHITWKSAVFNVGGRLNPFAGTKREGWLASADACERLGYPDIGAAYRRMAAEVDPDETPGSRNDASEAVEAPSSPRPPPRSAARRRSTWDGPPMPPPEPTPFKAAGQKDMFA